MKQSIVETQPKDTPLVYLIERTIVTAYLDAANVPYDTSAWDGGILKPFFDSYNLTSSVVNISSQSMCVSLRYFIYSAKLRTDTGQTIACKKLKSSDKLV
jgi:hypothetical protein